MACMLAAQIITLAIALASSTLAISISKSQPPIKSADACHKYVLITSRGTNEPQGPSIAFRGMVQQTLNALPGGIEMVNPFPASSAPDSPTQGAEWIRTFVENGVQNCPAQRYALLGWSQGAAVASLALALDGGAGGHPSLLKANGGTVYDHVDGVVLVGNPFRVPNRQGNTDEHGGFGFTDTATGMMGGSRPAGMDEVAADGKVLDVCYTSDGVCGSHGTDPGAHGKYGGDANVQAMGAHFLKMHLNL